ncbi:putative drug transport transmembrane protein [Caenispirillum salinarum AK4]|uniref:Putative drug transport transmembrane protein n=1 Tax=Caenispirillum salinarum AK4 TaxID=1238182 RepID=K9HBZ8_9PROT|nr:MFS transporter [Caenispirillum salinarum]EKV28068.1 putative drug transport transmembrane protein [Caenispirillum salinarum AK4]
MTAAVAHPAPAHMRRNVIVLSAAQALSMSTAVLVFSVSALAGATFGVDPALVTLPLSLQMVATMLATFPLAHLMAKVGRRAGFSVGQLFGIAGGLVSMVALNTGDFALFCAGGVLLGIHNASWQFLRFAAAETSSESFRPRAISWVLAGGIVAAVIGGELAKESREFLPAIFAGSYVATALLAAACIGLLQLLRMPPLPRASEEEGGRPFKQIAAQPAFIVAVLAAMFGYGVMSLEMVATPLAMTMCGFSFNESAWVIQWHVLGMFVPSFFTGNLIKRFGVLPIIITGALLNIACVAVALAGVDLANFFLAMVILGVGWNFMYIGGTTLLTETYRPQERAKVQAFNDCMVFGAVALASFGSGAMQNALGWSAVNLFTIAPIGLSLMAALWLLMMRRRASAAQAA